MSVVTKSRPARKAAAHAVASIALPQAVNIPLNRLRPTDRNVRRIKNGLSIHNLADSIARRGLLQSLSVRPAVDADGRETGDYDVQAGGRRHAALMLLVQQARLPADAPIPCIPKSTGLLEDDSLAENTDREDLHPLDQFRAFKTLADTGMAKEDIAAAHGVTPAVVTQRLRMVAASPKILAAFEKDDLTLDQVMGFCLTQDHARQELVFKSLGRNLEHYDGDDIRRLLAEGSVTMQDRRARFVGLKAYEKAGGTILRDLFSTKDTVYLQDGALLTELTLKKLEAEADAYRAKGWKWVDIAISHPYGREHQFRRIPVPPLSNKQQARYDDLEAQRDALAEREDELSDAEQKKLDKLDAAILEMDNREAKITKKDMVRAGVLIDISNDGKLDIVEGLLREEDLTPEERGHNRAAKTATGGTTEAQVQKPDIPERVIQDLTSYRTVALRNALAENFDIAFQSVLMQFVADCFYRYGAKSALQLRLTIHFPDMAPGLKDMAAARAIKERHAAWAARLPKNPKRLWTFLSTLNAAERADLFAHCAGLTLNAVKMPKAKEPEIERHAHQIAAAVSLDMTAAGFAPTADTYFARVTKGKIAEAVRDAKGEDTAKLIADLKKGEMAKEAARLVDGTGWLPDVLRTVEIVDPAEDAPLEEKAEPELEDEMDDELPEFLDGDDEA